jgi:hypothetical protein
MECAGAGRSVFADLDDLTATVRATGLADAVAELELSAGGASLHRRRSDEEVMGAAHVLAHDRGTLLRDSHNSLRILVFKLEVLEHREA